MTLEIPCNEFHEKFEMSKNEVYISSNLRVKIIMEFDEYIVVEVL